MSDSPYRDPRPPVQIDVTKKVHSAEISGEFDTSGQPKTITPNEMLDKVLNDIKEMSRDNWRPLSMEWGRAGGDRKWSQCMVIYTREIRT